ncbi:hypothetical protein L3Q82_004607 [Scortum barcoo]|uniref:Uncharacterized protein n=1 Tax=Scortum barcoo TaxID=214431 RepID=A0ACB8VGJ4_9TELE|nr:hypothetical protein L3Q82_004607 [Scortum barcoo]
MDPADVNTVRSALPAQGTKIHQHKTQLSSNSRGVKELTKRQTELQSFVANQVRHLAAQLQLVIACLNDLAYPKPASPAPAQLPTPTSLPSAAPRPIRLAPPEKYSGDSAQMAFMVSHLTVRAAAWATAEWSRGAAICQDVKVFSQTLSKLFDHSSPAREASQALLGLRQRSRRVIDYAIEFCTLARA